MFFMHRVAIRIYNIFTYQKKKSDFHVGLAEDPQNKKEI